MNLLQNYLEKYSEPFLNELNNFVISIFDENSIELNQIFRYHLGLDDDPITQGKRIRPLLLLLCTEGSGSDWNEALPAAAAIELIHNFSLIHDDIEDNGLIRRSKDSVWKKWGLAKGLNAGDAMFASAFIAINRLKSGTKSEKVIDTVELLSSTCLKLTEGQQLDIDFETRENVAIDEYYTMVRGKTSALLACCSQMGALLSGMNKDDQFLYSNFGNELGMAFQIYDDWLGVWGDPEITGKSASSDLIEGKKTLPILMGIEKSKRFLDGWRKKPLSPEMINKMQVWLSEDGIENEVKNEFNLWNNRALGTLNSLKCNESVRVALIEFANKLILRKK
jgi:geranylgeranyl diphosphate synthase, type I